MASASRIILSASTIDIGNSVAISIVPEKSEYKHTLKATINYETTVIASNVATSYAWVVPESIIDELPSDTFTTIKITCETYSSGELIGTSFDMLTAMVHESIVPSITSIDVEDSKGHYAKYGSYVLGKSEPSVHVAASGSHSSSIEKYKITANGSIYNSNDCKVLMLHSGSNTITATVTDSRGRTATQSTTINVIDYANPSITTFYVQRCKQDGTLDENGGYFKATFAASIYGLNGENSKEFQLRYKKNTETSWIVAETYDSAYTISEVLIIEADVDSLYDVKLVASDDFVSISKTVQLASSFTLMDFRSNGKGIAFGKVSEKDAFECALPAEFASNILSDGDIIDGNGNSISSRVAQTDYTGDTIASLINQSADSVIIEAKHINLNGYLTISAAQDTYATQSALSGVESTANTASSNASSAVSTANSASSDASSALSTANGIASNIYTSGTTTIDGGKITTGSISADKINVSDLSALNATIGGFTISNSNLSASRDCTGTDVVVAYIEAISASGVGFGSSVKTLTSGTQTVTLDSSGLKFSTIGKYVSTSEKDYSNNVVYGFEGIYCSNKHIAKISADTIEFDCDALARDLYAKNAYLGATEVSNMEVYGNASVGGSLTVSGTINANYNTEAINFRNGQSGYYESWCSHMTADNEALVFATDRSNTSILFKNGESASNISANRWKNIGSCIQIVDNRLSVGYPPETGGTIPDYLFRVNGHSLIDGNLKVSGETSTIKRGRSYMNLPDFYSPSVGMVKITLPYGVGMWTMIGMTIEVSGSYSANSGALLKFDGYHSGGGEWVNLSLKVLGYFPSITCYAENNNIYIGGLASYGRIRILSLDAGDTVRYQDLSNVTIEASSLPSSYQTATIKRMVYTTDTKATHEPDYSGAVAVRYETGSVTVSGTYTAPSNGWVYGYAITGSQSGEVEGRISINSDWNNPQWMGYQTRNYARLWSSMIPIKKGQSVGYSFTSPNSTGAAAFYFVPVD